MHYVGVGRRLLAGIVDGLIVLFGLGFGVAALTGKIKTQAGGVEFQLDGAAAVALFALGLAYFVVMEATLGATIGKLLVGVRVRTSDGDRIGWTASLARNLYRVVDVCLCFIGAVLI